MIDVEKPTLEEEAPEQEQTPEGSPTHVPALNLQADNVSHDAEQYELEELLRYHDRDFVLNLFAAVHKRAPEDAELVTTLNDLRSGRRTKIEIIEDMLAESDRPTIEVAGLSSPRLRAISRWPIVGYWIRLFVSLNRLPVLIRHQQQFEAHALGQQQKIADYLNEVVPGSINLHDQNSAAVGNLATVVNDAVDSVTMLSDSLIDLSARQIELQTDLQRQFEQFTADTTQQGRRLAETQTKLQNDLLAHIRQLQDVQARHAKAQTQLQADVTLIANNQAAQQQALDDTQRGLQETQSTLQHMQKGFEETQQLSQQTVVTAQQTQQALQQTQTAFEQTQQNSKQTQRDLEIMQQGLEQTQQAWQQIQEALQRTQIAIEEMQRAQSRTADAQQEFLIQEQQAIVETQKVVLGDLQTHLRELQQEQLARNDELIAELDKLKALPDQQHGRAAGRSSHKADK